MILQLVPMFSMLFLMTTAAGSALWAAELEDKKKAAFERSQRPEPEYHDQTV